LPFIVYRDARDLGAGDCHALTYGLANARGA
jgi:hypothetical protein